MPAMMCLLGRDVLLHGISSRRTYGKRGVSFLPSKVSVEILFDPIARILFQISHGICDAMHRTETRQYMHMIFDATNTFGDSVHSSDNSTEIRMQSWPPFAKDKRLSFLRRENNV